MTIKPSIDGVGNIHDEIRGVKGNFKQLDKTISYLKELEKDYKNFHLELATVISNFNINHLSEIEDYVHSLGVQSYGNEIAKTEPNSSTSKIQLHLMQRRIKDLSVNFLERFAKTSERNENLQKLPSH